MMASMTSTSANPPDCRIGSIAIAATELSRMLPKMAASVCLTSRHVRFFADFENRGLQDLLVVCAAGPLLFSNDGKGSSLSNATPSASRVHRKVRSPMLSIADYDHDGRLDIYFCLYNYYQGLDQYRYPVPYFDARNGPPNYLFHNEGDGIFRDRTEAAGLDVENDRYSFACSWGDSNGDGWPDLYVVNDFGRNVLYRNKGGRNLRRGFKRSTCDEAGAGYERMLARLR